MSVVWHALVFYQSFGLPTGSTDTPASAYTASPKTPVTNHCMLHSIPGEWRHEQHHSDKSRSGCKCLE